MSSDYDTTEMLDANGGSCPLLCIDLPAGDVPAIVSTESDSLRGCVDGIEVADLPGYVDRGGDRQSAVTAVGAATTVQREDNHG